MPASASSTTHASHTRISRSTSYTTGTNRTLPRVCLTVSYRISLSTDTHVLASHDDIIYPDLPRYSRTASKRMRPPGAIKQAPAVPVTPANIGRRRSQRLASLTNTPPRPSYSAQLSNIFARSAPTKFAPSVPMTAESMQKPHCAFDNSTARLIPCTPPRFGNPSNHELRTELPSSPHDSVVEALRDENSDDEDPLDDLQRAVTLPSSPFDAVSINHNAAHMQSIQHSTGYPRPQTERRVLRFNATTLSSEACSTQSSGDTSSEEWTGDDEFLPHSARRRHREQRLAQKKAAAASPIPSHQLPSRHLQLFTTVEEGPPLRSPGASRFQSRRLAAVGVFNSPYTREVFGLQQVLTTATTGFECQTKMLNENGTSDADDELDSSD